MGVGLGDEGETQRERTRELGCSDLPGIRLGQQGRIGTVRIGTVRQGRMGTVRHWAPAPLPPDLKVESQLRPLGLFPTAM